jgi:hypothetical protein
MKKILWVSGIFVIVGISQLLINCGSSTTTAPNTPDQSETVIPNPSFSQDIQSIFNNSCALSGCHNATASAGLNLSSGQAYANLVNVASTQDPSKMRVLPNDSQNSYLVIKIEGNQSTGGRMPLNASPLSSTKIQNIKNWINNGANNN